LNFVPLPQLYLWLDPDRLNGPAHMARDEALVNVVDVPVLRVYRWPSPQLSIGYFCELAEVRREFGNMPIVRRWTGGGIVPHGSDWTFALALPGHREPAAGLYCRIHQALAQALAEAGFTAELQGEAAGQPGGACFTNPVTSDLMHAGQKIAGGAQRRNRRGVLHQGSVQISDLDPIFFERFSAFLAQRVETWVPSMVYLNEAKRLITERYSDPIWEAKY